MNGIKIFENTQFGQIRTAGTAEEPLFCLADVCKAVELSNPSSIKSRLDKDDVQLIDLHALNYQMIGNSMATFVTETGFYEVLLFSSSPKVKPFRKWITHDILPSIRKTGGYGIPKTYAEALRLAADQQERIEKQQRRIEADAKEIKELNGAIIAMQPKITYVDAILASRETVTITQIAQDYGCPAKTFNGWLRDFGIQHKVGDQWILYAKYLPCGYVQSYTISIKHRNGSAGTVMHTKWTQKGRLFLYEELKGHGIFPLIEQDGVKSYESNTQQIPQ